MPHLPPTPAPSQSSPGEYVVVARRYRPQTFDELIGQEHVAKALKGAISSDRVGHAYLFTGARGVGKTSAARILAKALNCERGPTPQPCNACEACRSIAAGDDIDVLEIDGASNRGIDEIRQLRQNVAVRPSRSRFKIYIIDEVHMLTKEAFNALLKTLEEPPEHVKFIFATTEANKIPITILSRCQRYDFAGIDATAIQTRLADIAAKEGVVAEPDALAILAIRAAGSMRDSQSLLEQLLSTGKRTISADDVTTLLGLAPAVRLSRLIEPMVNRDAATALTELDDTIAGGADVGQLIDQLLGFFRDCMTQAAGCPDTLMLYALPGQREQVRRIADELGIPSLLAVWQVLDQAAARLRASTQVRTLLEMAIVRICQLHDLAEIAELIAGLKNGSGDAVGAAGAKKNGPPSRPPATPGGSRESTYQAQRPGSSPRGAVGRLHSESDIQANETGAATGSIAVESNGATEGKGDPAIKLDDASAPPVWGQVLERLSGLVADSAAEATELCVDEQGRLVASFPSSQRFSRDLYQRPANLAKLEAALAEVCGGPVGLVLAVHEDNTEAASAEPRPSQKQIQADAAAHPFVERAIELFDGDPARLKFVPSEGGR